MSKGLPEHGMAAHARHALTPRFRLAPDRAQVLVPQARMDGPICENPGGFAAALTRGVPLRLSGRPSAWRVFGWRHPVVPANAAGANGIKTLSDLSLRYRTFLWVRPNHSFRLLSIL